MEKKFDMTPLVNIFGKVVSRALEGAAEALLEETQDKIDEVSKRVSKARSKIKSYKKIRKDNDHIEVTSVRKQ
jgi:hypothetical protein